jgi:hypothetical protein
MTSSKKQEHHRAQRGYTTRDLEPARCRAKVARGLPLMESAWVDALAKTGRLTRFQANEINGVRGLLLQQRDRIARLRKIDLRVGPARHPGTRRLPALQPLAAGDM